MDAYEHKKLLEHNKHVEHVTNRALHRMLQAHPRPPVPDPAPPVPRVAHF
jgi:hypothetical protein